MNSNKLYENIFDKTKYELIDTPYELFIYMHFNIAYKWMDQTGRFHEQLNPKMYQEYSLMTPQEVVNNHCGICVDQVELERDWFENAWGDNKGIHSYATREELIEAVKHKFIVQNNIYEQELDNLTIATFPKYPSHFSYEQMDDYDNNKIK